LLNAPTNIITLTKLLYHIRFGIFLKRLAISSMINLWFMHDDGARDGDDVALSSTIPRMKVREWGAWFMFDEWGRKIRHHVRGAGRGGGGQVTGGGSPGLGWVGGKAPRGVR
jgi:hypothetical protein